MSSASITQTERATLTIDGVEVPFAPGETVYEVADRHQGQIPTLCYDPRLEPFGGCRLCVVEVEGIPKPVASCTTQAASGMVVRTRTEKLEKQRKTLLEMVASENRQIQVDPLSGYASQELAVLADRYGVHNGRFAGSTSGTSSDDDNPFILRDYEQCISCYRCVPCLCRAAGRLRHHGSEPRISRRRSRPSSTGCSRIRPAPSADSAYRPARPELWPTSRLYSTRSFPGKSRRHAASAPTAASVAPWTF